MGVGGYVANGTKGGWPDAGPGPTKYMGGVATNEVGVVATEG